MKCTDKSFILNTTILHIKRTFVKFDFMPNLKKELFGSKPTRWVWSEQG